MILKILIVEEIEETNTVQSYRQIMQDKCISKVSCVHSNVDDT